MAFVATRSTRGTGQRRSQGIGHGMQTQTRGCERLDGLCFASGSMTIRTKSPTSWKQQCEVNPQYSMPRWLTSVRYVKRRFNLDRDASPRAHLVPVGVGPITDCADLLLVTPSGLPPSDRKCSTVWSGRTSGLTRGCDLRSVCRPGDHRLNSGVKLLSVWGAQVDQDE